MKILVTAASTRGSTTEIAEAIGTRLRGRGHEVDVVEPAIAAAPDGYDALVIGSAVYAGSWLSASRDYISRNAEALASTRVWLFSSGPLDGGPGSRGIGSSTVRRLASASGSLGHHVFSGKLDRSTLNPVERIITTVVHAPEGDFRDWDDVTRWSDEIADALV